MPSNMTFLESWFWVEVGMICSLLLPFAKAALAQAFPRGMGAQTPSWAENWAWIKIIAARYVKYFFFTLIVSLAVKMLSGRIGFPIKDETDAFIAGLLGESIVDKFLRERLTKSTGETGPPPTDLPHQNPVPSSQPPTVSNQPPHM